MRKASVLVFLSWLSLFAGCRPYYVPPAANAPLLGSAGEIHAAAQANSSSQADVQLAFAPMDYLAIQAALSLAEWDDDWHKHTYGEVGAGTFIPFGIGRFEAFVGGGYGDAKGKGLDWLDLDPESSQTWVQGPYRRLYLQMDIGLSTKIIDFGLMSRWSWLRADLDYSDGSSQTTYGSFLEEIIFFRVGHDPVKAEFQGGWIWPTTNELRIEFIPWHFSLGLHVKFDLWGVDDDDEDEDEAEEAESKPAAKPASDDDGGWKEVNQPGGLWTGPFASAG